MHKLTFDTNSLINLFEYKEGSTEEGQTLAAILGFTFEGRAEIQVTSRVENDLETDKVPERSKGILARIYKMFQVIPAGFRINGDLSDEQTQQEWSEIQRIIFPTLSSEEKRYRNKLNDLDHLLAHFRNRRDIFVTSDEGILKKAPQLRTLGINVLSPKEMLALLETESLVSNTKKDPPPRRTDYHNPLATGLAAFDFSNNNGSFIIGSGDMVFHTHWSECSQERMHAYSDGESVHSIALAKGTQEIKDLKDSKQYDFTSRARELSLKDILILRNHSGYYAALRILSIEVEDRGDKKDELVFMYVIQPNKTDILNNLKWPKVKS